MDLCMLKELSVLRNILFCPLHGISFISVQRDVQDMVSLAYLCQCVTVVVNMVFIANMGCKYMKWVSNHLMRSQTQSLFPSIARIYQPVDLVKKLFSP